MSPLYLSQIYTPGLAQCSYVIGGQTECLIVDPPRDADRCLDVARSHGLSVTGVIQTHLHADFISGHMDLARDTGATVYAPAAAGCAFQHVPLDHGEEVSHERLLIRLIETPGHTPEGAVFVVSDLDRGPEPALAFTGDTLLVGDVGRPDLFPERKRELAAALFDSIGRILDLPDRIEVYPAHGMGSLCGRSLSAKLSTTIGNERLYNYALNITDREQFITELLTGMPEAPDHFARCSEINRLGPTPVAALPAPRPLSAEQFTREAAAGIIVDTRDYLSFAGAHVPGAINLGWGRLNFSLFAGWVLPPDQSLYLVLDRQSDLEPVLWGLRRVGLDNVAGYLAGGMDALANAGLPADGIECIAVPELKARMDRESIILVDTRLDREWQSGHIDGAIHIPAPEVCHRRDDLPPDRPIYVICSTGNRSSLAASLLRRAGAARVINVAGGMTGWHAAGYTTTV